jgi:LPS export ABC transporter protein LptC
VTRNIQHISKEGWPQRWPSFLILFFSLAPFLQSCDQVGHQRIIEYNGPVREGDSIEMLYAEEDHLKIKMIAGKVKQFDNGDREFPDGLFVEFYDSLQVTSTLSANSAYYFRSTNKWRAQGKVQLKSLQKDEQLNTEELFWYPATKKVYTEKFVTIRTGSEVIYGTGLDADQNLTNYQIRRVEGEFEVDENGNKKPE